MADFALKPMIPRALTDDEAPETRKHQGIPGVQRLASGRLFAVYYTGKIAGEGVGNYVVLATSVDSGLSWKEVQVVAPREDEPLARAYDSEIWEAPDGALWWFWTQSHSEGVWGYDNEFDGRSGVWAARCAAPDTDFPEWELPRRLGEGVMMNKPTVLDDGTWVLPASLWMKSDKTPEEYRKLRGASVLLSHDGGRTFRQVPGPRVPMDVAVYDEHCVIQRKDGTLWMLIRTLGGIWQSDSRDRGESWSSPVPAPFGKTCSRFALRSMPSGALLFIHHQGRERLPGEAPTWFREMLTAWISDDDGETWKAKLLLDERCDVSYPSVSFGDDGFIYVIYDRARLHAGQILLTRFTEQDLRAGEYLSCGGFQRLVVGSFGKMI